MPEPLTAIIEAVSDLGYDGIEIWGRHLPGVNVDELMSALHDRDLKVSMISPYFDLTGSRDARLMSVKEAGDYIDVAALLGAPLIRGFTGVVGSGDATREQFSACVAALREICARASEKHITVALETHPKTLVDTVPAALRLIEAVDHPHLKLNLDIYHLWEVHFDPIFVVNALFDHVVHVHAKNAAIPPHSHYPLLHDKQATQDIFGVTRLSEGNMSYPAFLAELAQRDFRGFISLEWFGPDVLKTAAQELAYLREMTGERQSIPADSSIRPA